MQKRDIPVMLLAPALLLAPVILTEPSRASAVGAAEMAPVPAVKGGAKPGEWQDYNTAQEHVSKAKQIPSGTLVVIAYVIIWAVVLIYVLLLALRQKRLRSEVAELRRCLDEVDPPAGAGDTKQT